TGVGAAQLGRHLRVGAGQALDVGLVDHGVGVPAAGPGVVAPVEGGVGDHAQHGVPGAVARVGPVRVTFVRRGVVVDLPVDGGGVRVEEQLRRVAAVAGRRVPGAVHPVAVALPGADAGEVAVPHEAVGLGQRDGAVPPLVVDQDQVDALGDLAEQGEVGALPVRGRTQR